MKRCILRQYNLYFLFMNKFFSSLVVFICFLFFTCSSDDGEKTLSDENFITSFKLSLNNEYKNGVIDQASGTITFDVIGANLNNLTPTIIYSENATISPSPISSQNFENPVIYNVTAENGDVKQYTVNVGNRPIGTDSKILSFSFEISGEVYNCNIDNTTNIISLETVGLDLTSIVPDITISEYANISPIPVLPQNFTETVVYEVTAENGTSTTYEVQIDNRPISTENKILAFSVEHGGQNYTGVIDEDINEININFGDIDISALTPQITISEYATISPSPNLVQDFNGDIVYTVTAESGDTSSYTVVSNKPTISNLLPNIFQNYKYFTGLELTIYGNYIDPNVPNAVFKLQDGTNEYLLEDVTLVNTTISSNAIQYQIKATIPHSVPTSNNYTLVFSSDSVTAEFDNILDVMSEGPDNMTLNQTSYNYNDILVINGTNLVPGLIVPSNGSNFLVQNSNNYDIEVNSDQTELTWTLNYFQHFPSYYGQSSEEKRIYTLGSGQRIGKAVYITFN